MSVAGSAVEGCEVTHKRLFRICREEKLTVRRRGGAKRATDTGSPILIPVAPDGYGALGLVSGQLADGRRFRVLTVVDDCTRECIALVVDTSLSGLRGTRKPQTLITSRGRPKMIITDNGTAFTSSVIPGLADRDHIDWHHSAPGQPGQNVFSRLNALLRARAGRTLAALRDSASLRPDAQTASGPQDMIRIKRDVLQVTKEKIGRASSICSVEGNPTANSEPGQGLAILSA